MKKRNNQHVGGSTLCVCVCVCVCRGGKLNIAWHVYMCDIDLSSMRGHILCRTGLGLRDDVNVNYNKSKALLRHSVRCVAHVCSKYRID